MATHTLAGALCRPEVRDDANLGTGDAAGRAIWARVPPSLKRGVAPGDPSPHSLLRGPSKATLCLPDMEINVD